MSKYQKIERIIDYIENNLSDIHAKVFINLLNDSKDYVLYNFNDLRAKYINLCNGNPFILDNVLSDLDKSKIIFLGHNNISLICLSEGRSCLKSNFKRKLNQERIKLCLFQIKAKKAEKRGFKVPSTLMPYLSGEPLSEEEQRSILRVNPTIYFLEQQRRNLSKEVIRVYCALISLADQDGYVACDNYYTIYISFIRSFGKESFNLQTWYNAINKLLELGLIIKTEVGLRVNGIGQKERYVIIPFVVFDKDFKKLEVASVRMFFNILFHLNNGESLVNGKYENLKHDKAYFLKLSGYRSSQESIEVLKKTMKQVRKRYPCELIKCLAGNLHIFALRKYFDFTLLPGAVFMIKVKPEYYISKTDDFLKDTIELRTNCTKRMIQFKQLLSKYNHKIPDSHIILVWRQLRNYSRYKLRNVFKAIEEKLQSGMLNFYSILKIIEAT